MRFHPHSLLLLALCVGCASSTPPAATPPAATPPTRVAKDHHAEPIPAQQSWQYLAKRAVQYASTVQAFLGQARADELYGLSRAVTRDPYFYIDYGKSRATRDSDNRKTNGSTMRFGVRLYTSNPFENRHIRQQGESRAQATYAEAALEQQIVTLAVYELCIEQLTATDQIAIYHEIITHRTTLVAHLQKQLDAGMIQPYPLLQAKMQLLEDRAKVNELKAVITATHRDLATLTAIPQDKIAPVLAEADLARLATQSPKEIQAQIETPAITLAQARIREAQALIDAAQARRIPWFEYVDFSSGSGKDKDHTPAANAWDADEYSRTKDREWSVKTAITIPVFSWFSSEVAEATRLKEAAQNDLAVLQRTLRADIAAATQAYQSTYQFVKDYQQEALPLLAAYQEALDNPPDAAPPAELIKTALRQQEARLRLSDLAHQLRVAAAPLLTRAAR